MATGYSVMDALNKQTKAGIDDTTPKAKFRTKDISIFKIYKNEQNFYPQEEIEQKAGEILAIGLLENLVVRYKPLDGIGDYELISGERRWNALHILVQRGHKEFEFVTCNIISPASTQEEKIALILANSHRVKDTETMIREEQELKATLEDMKANNMELKGYDLQSGRLRDIIADMLNMSKTKIAQIDAVSNNLIPEFVEEMNKKRLTFSAAYELSGMSSEEQRKALEVFIDTGELTYQTIKDMKEKKTEEEERKQLDGQMVLNENGECVEKEERQQESDSDTKGTGTEESGTEETNTAAGKKEEEHRAGDDYEPPHPEGITSLCYSCTEYETCNVKTGICTKCDQYRNRTETYKTEEQRYSEEQDRIDRETAKKLREKADEEKMKNIPSDTQESGRKVHQIRVGTTFFDDAASGKKNFTIRKNDRGYKVGDILEKLEFADGKNTGRSVRLLVTYLLEDFTGLEDGYCIMGTSPITEEKEQPQLPIMTNNNQRGDFVDSYKDWPVWIDRAETEERYYRYDFQNGKSFVVKAYFHKCFDFKSCAENWEYRYRDGWGAEEYYILEDGKHFKDCLTNKSAMIEFLKNLQKKGEI